MVVPALPEFADRYGFSTPVAPLIFAAFPWASSSDGARRRGSLTGRRRPAMIVAAVLLAAATLAFALLGGRRLAGAGPPGAGARRGPGVDRRPGGDLRHHPGRRAGLPHGPGRDRRRGDRPDRAAGGRGADRRPWAPTPPSRWPAILPAIALVPALAHARDAAARRPASCRGWCRRCDGWPWCRRRASASGRSPRWPRCSRWWSRCCRSTWPTGSSCRRSASASCSRSASSPTSRWCPWPDGCPTSAAAGRRSWWAAP